MATFAEIIAEAEARLRPISEIPRLDAEILLAASLGADRAHVLARLRDEADAPNFEALLLRRLNHEPIAYILGEWEFFGMNFECRAPVLVPRPETEHLVETVLTHVGDIDSPRILDVCTGSGCVALAIAQHCPSAQVYALDKAQAAITLASENTALHKNGRAPRLFYGDMMEALMEAPVFDVICSNPPYVEVGDWAGLPEVIKRHEDPGALLAGEDGLDCIRRLVAQAAPRLKPGGLLTFELGEGQADSAIALLEANGHYEAFGRVKDLAGIERIVTARRVE